MTTYAQSEVVDRLTGARLPQIALPTTDGGAIYLSKLPNISVVYIFPRISPAGGTAIEGWDEIPGAKGCTAQSCAFRDRWADLLHVGVDKVFGLSAQSMVEQTEAAQRLRLEFPLICDAEGALQAALNLPTFHVEKMTLLQRMTFILRDGFIEKVFFPISEPSTNAADVFAYLSAPRGEKR